VIGIGASTGGPPALATVLGALPANYPLPVLVVQHMAHGFLDGLVDWLDRQVEIPVGFASAGAPATGGVWFAPEDAHLRIDRSLCFGLDTRTVRGPHRPSVDILLESLADAAHEAALGVVLTGMGRDGAEGARALRAAGGLLVTQDEATSAVFGMPREAALAGPDQVLPLEDIGPLLRRVRPALVAA
jgi:two-component system chemotaxis response regulator CheB